MRFLAAVAGIALALLAGPPAEAQNGGRDSHRFQRPQQERGAAPPPAQQRREAAEAAREGQRGADRPRGYLTPEERQQLRRDIREHGGELYRDRRQRPGHR